MIFSVKRIINGKPYLRDEDRMIASSWDEAESKLTIGVTAGRYDSTCSIEGILIEDIGVSDSFLEEIRYKRSQLN
ncbi:hypothetical protein GGR06_001618 [Bacteroides reticulotermitis]|uniref:Uncharacterized protein n=1 Tax=Bacteroides reticulotermitis TaxID=1133319 RepID=A0A840D5W9_9BACE|nr:hypothetical protein [Bacteroides reticulotermitis]MBB4043832.1 hypothetical protein [Bacteroides reticulotermitis]